MYEMQIWPVLGHQKNRDRNLNIMQCADNIYVSNVEYLLKPIIEQKGIKEQQIYCLSLFYHISYHVNKVEGGGVD